MPSLTQILFAITLTLAGVAEAASPLKKFPAELDEDEGFLLLAFDSDIDIRRVKLRRVGQSFPVDTLKRIKAGDARYFLYRLEAGDYYLSELEPDHGAQTRQAELSPNIAAMTVLPGILGYPGTLVVRVSEDVYRGQFVRHNRASQAIRYLDEMFPNSATARFAYVGAALDAYPVRLRDRDRSAIQSDRVLPQSGTAVVDPTPYFLAPRIAQTSMSPDGKIVLMEVHEGAEKLIEAVLPGALKSFVLQRFGDGEISRFHWLGSRTFGFELYAADLMVKRFVVGRFDVEDNQIVDADFRLFSEWGTIFDPVVDDDSYMLVSMLGNLYKYPLQRHGPLERQYYERFKLDVELPAGGVPMTDSTHQIRFIIDRPGATSGEHQFWYRDEQGKWSVIAKVDAAYDYRPIGFGALANTLVMLTNHQRDTKAVMRFDLVSGTFTETLFEAPGVDLTDAELDSEGHLRSVDYLMAGKPKRVYFDTDDRQAVGAIEATLKTDFQDTAHVISRSVDNRYRLFLMEGPATAPRYFYYDNDLGSAIELGASRPWLKQQSVRTELVTATTDEGLMLEGYLILPPDNEKSHPLVVMPHGGPMGYRWDNRFDPEALYLVANGMAVLKPNFRGSGGYGRAFEDAGKGEAGRAIEDDVEALTDTVVARQDIDGDRVCAYGASYGGYSSLMLTARNAERYRCAAAFAAPTDIQLMFSASDWMHNERARAVAIQWYGDPDEDGELMNQRSPVYLAQELSRPLLLAHGAEDYRVDIEHYFRLTEMLDLEGRAYQSVIYPEAGHGLTGQDSEDFYRRLAAFLSHHLHVQDGRVSAR